MRPPIDLHLTPSPSFSSPTTTAAAAIPDDDVHAFFRLLQRVLLDLEEARRLGTNPSVRAILAAHPRDAEYIAGTLNSARAALTGIAGVRDNGGEGGLEAIRAEWERAGGGPLGEASRAWIGAHRGVVDARQAELQACHKSLLHAMGRMQAWRDEQMRHATPATAVVETSPTIGLGPSMVTGSAGAGPVQRYESIRRDLGELGRSPYRRRRMIEQRRAAPGEWIRSSSRNGADGEENEPRPASTNPSDPSSTSSPASTSPVLAAQPLSQQGPALFADIIQQLADSERHFQPVSRPQYSGASHSESFMDAQQAQPPSLDNRSSLPGQDGNLSPSPQPIARPFEPPRRDTLGSESASPSLSSAREVSDSSPSLPWLQPRAASSATSLPSQSFSGSPPALSVPFTGDSYQIARGGAIELPAIAPPSCLIVPMPVDVQQQRESTAFSNPPGAVSTGYARMPSANLPWNIRYTNFQGAGTMSDPALEKILGSQGGAEDKMLGAGAEDEKILGSQSGADDKIMGVQADGEKILGSPSNGEKISHEPPTMLPRTTGPVLWDAPPAAHVTPPPPPATHVTPPAAQSAAAAPQVPPKQPLRDHEIPEVLGPPPPADHSHARAASVDTAAAAAAAAPAAVSQVVLDLRRRRARHQLFDDL